MAQVRIDALTADHREAVLAIYQAGLDTRNASFETQAPEWATWDQAHLAAHRFVAIAPDPAPGAETLPNTGEVLGEHLGRWRDVVLVERRSPVVGPSPTTR